MEMKSVADCLDFFDNMILYNIGKIDSMESLESMPDYFLDLLLLIPFCNIIITF